MIFFLLEIIFLQFSICFKHPFEKISAPKCRPMCELNETKCFWTKSFFGEFFSLNFISQKYFSSFLTMFQISKLKITNVKRIKSMQIQRKTRFLFNCKDRFGKRFFFTNNFHNFFNVPSTTTSRIRKNVQIPRKFNFWSNWKESFGEFFS